MKIKYFGTVIGKQFIPHEPTSYAMHMEKLEGKRVYSIIEQDRPTRSNSQNNYYFGVVVAVLSEELGYSAEEMHDIIKWKFLKEPLKIERSFLQGDIPNTREITVWKAGSTTDLDTAGFEKTMEQIRLWALTELGIRIPLPNECA